MLPEIYTFFISALAIIAIVLGIFILTRFNTLHSSMLKTDKIARWSLVGVSLAALILVFSFFAPLIFSGNLFIGNFDKQDADNASTFNGFVAPFVAVSAVITTGLAFFMQYQANRQIQDQFKIQQFESQFYEMLRLHKENVNEMSIDGYEYLYTDLKNKSKERRVTSGRKVFVTMVTELTALFIVVKKTYLETSKSAIMNEFVLSDQSEQKKYFRLAYDIFFQGVDSFIDSIPKLSSEFSSDFLEKLKGELRNVINLHKNGQISNDIYDPKRIKNYLFGKSNYTLQSSQRHLPIVDLKLYFNYKPFSGHQSRLGHYYRHMFNLVKHVVQQPLELLTYEDKRKYLKIFRSQLSNHEVVMLFYNWLGEYGKAWEIIGDNSKKRRRYFSDYRILHNLDGRIVMRDFDILEEFSTKKFREFVYKEGRAENDTLFSNFEIKSILTKEENMRIKNRM